MGIAHPVSHESEGKETGGELGELAMQTCPPGPSRAAHTPTRSGLYS